MNAQHLLEEMRDKIIAWMETSTIQDSNAINLNEWGAAVTDEKEYAILSILLHNLNLRDEVMHQFGPDCEFDDDKEWSMLTDMVGRNAEHFLMDQMHYGCHSIDMEDFAPISWRRNQWISVGHDEVDGFFTRFTYHEQFL